MRIFIANITQANYQKFHTKTILPDLLLILSTFLQPNIGFTNKKTVDLWPTVKKYDTDNFISCFISCLISCLISWLPSFPSLQWLVLRE
jgi:hypothetical protein